MARHFQLAAAIVLLALLVSVQVAGAVTAERIYPEIDRGVAWLASQQKDDGSWGSLDSDGNPIAGYQGLPNRVAKTAFAVMKLVDYARETHKEPLGTDYLYSSQITKGLNFIVGQQHDDGSIWDGPQIYEVPPPKVFETGVAVLALSDANRTEDLQVVQGAVDYLVRAQHSPLSPGGDGGWAYTETTVPPFPDGDQFNTGYAVAALLAARNTYHLAQDPVALVKPGLEAWIDGIQDRNSGAPGFGGSWFMVDYKDWEPSIVDTGSLLLEMNATGDTDQTQRVKDAISFMNVRWEDPTDWPGWRGDGTGGLPSYQAMFTSMEGFESLWIDTFDSRVWFNDFATATLDTQLADGSWPADVSSRSDPLYATGWALLTLEGKTPSAAMTIKVVTPTEVSAGQQATCDVYITNSGESGIYGLTLTELSNTGTTFGLAEAPYGGDTNGNGILDVGETWSYHGSANPTETFQDIITAGGMDYRGNEVTVTNDVLLTVNQPPDTSRAFPSLSCLWPPNHTYVDVTVQGVIDPDGDPVKIRIDGVTSDEPPGSVTGAGGKAHDPDAKIDGASVALLRAERSGNNDGRVYTILFTALDVHDLAATGSVKVCVPHDRGEVCPCIDDGQKYDATKIS
jgi:hypothetical protein